MSNIFEGLEETQIRNIVMRALMSIENQINMCHAGAAWGTAVGHPFVDYWSKTLNEYGDRFREHNPVEEDELIPLDVMIEVGTDLLNDIKLYLETNSATEPYENGEWTNVAYQHLEYVYEKQIKRMLEGVTIQTLLKELKAEKEIVATVEEDDV
jgi:hypothetical protein